MDKQEEIQEFVAQGYVLNDHGEWIPLAQKANKERDFIKHLIVGEVLYKGQWEKLTKVLRLEKMVQEASALPELIPAHNEIVPDMQTPEEKAIAGFAPETVYGIVEVTEDTQEGSLAAPEAVGGDVSNVNDGSFITEETVLLHEPKKAGIDTSRFDDALIGSSKVPSEPDGEEAWDLARRRQRFTAWIIAAVIASVGGVAAALMAFIF